VKNQYSTGAKPGISGLRIRPSNRIAHVGLVAIFVAATLSQVSLGAAGAASLNASKVPLFIPTVDHARGVAVSGSKVYWTNTWLTPIGPPNNNTTIGSSNLDGTGVNQNFITGANTPSGIVVVGSFIYWSNNGTNSIGRANINGTGVNQSFITGANGPVGLASDGTFLYWTNYVGNSIGRANVSGATATGVNQSFIATAPGPYGVTTDGTLLFWSIYGPDTGFPIGRSNVNGTGVTPAFITTPVAPTGIAVSNNRLYWSNYYTNSIGTSDINGTVVNQNLMTGLNGPVGLAITNDYLFWTNFNGTTIGRTVFDHVAPVLTVPANFTVTGVASGANAVTYSTPVSAIDATDVPADVTTTCTPGTLTGGSFVTGTTTTVTCTATDISANSSTASFTVTVVPPDTISPVVTANIPAEGATVAKPVVISGSATDNVGVAAVVVRVYRPVGTGQYWTGSTWQNAYAQVLATLSNPNAPTSSWTYSFDPPENGGLYYASAVAVDTSSGYGSSPFRSFKVLDSFDPVAAITAPVASSQIPKPVAITGTLTDNSAVAAAEIAIYSNNTWWNGSAWQAAYVRIPLTIASPGAATTTFTYTFNPPDQTGWYATQVLVYDSSYRYSLTTYTIFGIADTTAATGTVTNPVANASVARPVAMSGNASDNVGVTAVELAIYNSASQWWNGTTWQAAYTRVAATLSAPNSTATSWTYSFSPPSGGSYWMNAVFIDPAYNYSVTAFRNFTAT
jgi:virginiamycin B lyase